MRNAKQAGNVITSAGKTPAKSHPTKDTKMKATATISTAQGYTGKDHLLAEIARKASESLRPSYSSRSAAKKAAERAIYRTVASRPLYAGCAAGLVPGAK